MASIGKRPSSATSDIKLVQQKGLTFAYINRIATFYLKKISIFVLEKIKRNHYRNNDFTFLQYS